METVILILILTINLDGFDPFEREFQLTKPDATLADCEAEVSRFENNPQLFRAPYSFKSASCEVVPN